MIQQITKFINWLNEDVSSNDESEQMTSCSIEGYIDPWTEVDIRHDSIILNKLQVLKRSGLALPHEVWDEFVLDTVVRFAQWCQDLPASESYHHSGKRGLFLHSLDVAIYAMRLRRNYILPPNTPPEEVIHREIVWVYGVFLCALLHDCGKLMDFEIELYCKEKPIRWTPVLGFVKAPYRFRYYKDRHYASHKYSGLSLLNQLLSENPMEAISEDRQLYYEITAYLSGNSDSDSVIGQIIKQADAASVAQDLGADSAGINTAAEKAKGSSLSLASQLRLTLCQLIQSGEIPLNKKGAEGFVDGDSLFLVSKTIGDKIRNTLMERGITNVPSDNSRLFNVLQQHHLIRPNDDDMAIWKCEVYLTSFEWRQTFTFVCVHWPSLLPDETLESMEGKMTLVASDSTQNEERESATNKSDEALNEVTVEPLSPMTSSQDLMGFLPGLPDDIDADSSADEPEPECDNITAESSVNDDDQRPEYALMEKLDLRDISTNELGEAFYQWVDRVLCGGVHQVNKKGAMFHRLEEGMLVVSPGAFRTFIEERCRYGKNNAYSLVQQGLQPLELHIKRENGQSVHQAMIKDSEKTLNGFLFPTKPEWENIYSINPYVYLEDK
ncbi:helicase [Vibrio sp. MACH09]|uniref:MobH family relaxase n=1 Tax=Vibrio sp. MACH09 TaxID=3025122 RepID=UPI00278EA6CE|nr:MobH family relaxase [Vibrio sp. MACH09]GLO64106.1 helicase [Vibrio sp. MACH09]